MKSDPGVGEEALSDHPAERDAREVVAASVVNGASADVWGERE